MYLFFDTETTGLPRSWNAPVSDLNNWPRLVQIAWLLYDENGNRVSGKDYIIKPQGFTIPADSAKIHGITTERVVKEGVLLKDVLTEFAGLISQASHLVAHNINFDEKIVGAEFLRESIKHRMLSIKKICTMSTSTSYCKLPGKYGDYKWPKLSELHFKLFNEGFEEAHNATVDIAACAKCFWELKKRKII